MRWALALIFCLLAFRSFAEETVYLPLKAIPKHLKVDRLIQLDQFRVVALLANSLYEVGPKLQIDGKLAKSSVWDKDRKRLTIQLADARFPDGHEISADDVIRSVSACINPNPRLTFLFLGVSTRT